MQQLLKLQHVHCTWATVPLRRCRVYGLRSHFNYKLNPTNNTNFKDTTARQVVQMPRLYVTLRHVNWH